VSQRVTKQVTTEEMNEWSGVGGYAVLFCDTFHVSNIAIIARTEQGKEDTDTVLKKNGND
jgi:hypothetical protein